MNCGRDLPPSFVLGVKCSGVWQCFAFQLCVGGVLQWSVAILWLASGAKWGEVWQWFAFQFGVGAGVQCDVPTFSLSSLASECAVCATLCWVLQWHTI